MSTSPRIDALLGHLAEQGRELCERSCPQALVDEARRIELELTAAKDRIKRLEAAGDELNLLLKAVGIPLGPERIRWLQAKEAKP